MIRAVVRAEARGQYINLVLADICNKGTFSQAIPEIQMVKLSCDSDDRLSWAQWLFGSLWLLLLISVSVQAVEAPDVFGVATGRWYVQAGPEDDIPEDTDLQMWDYGLYLDLGYNANFNDPENKLWRSKGTTYKVNEPQVNLALAFVSKEAAPTSRWGMEFGLQAGVDTQSLVPQPPPASNEPISNADTWRHLYRANGSYLFPVGDGLEVTAGLINSYIGYESYLAIQNINYTRGYILDFVPYFMIGAQGAYPVTDALDISLFVVNGWNYLANPNDTPSLGFQSDWRFLPRFTYIQNVYYGPDQEEAGLEYWRFFSDSIIEWKSDQFVVAGALDFGSEKQADVAGNPRFDWVSGALWFGWHIRGPWNLGLRSEFFSDPDGIATGSKQDLQAITGTLQYTMSPVASNTIVLSAEYRYDHSSGPEGGFFKGDNNELVSDQHQVIFSLMWAFGP